MEIFTRRVRYGRNGHKDGTAEFRVKDESDGTQRFIGLSGQLLGAMERGATL